jgi:hypothetical protein
MTPMITVAVPINTNLRLLKNNTLSNLSVKYWY